ncbi:hypothetical protein ACJJTC_016141 [Scirpophaga incertulas]
MTEECASKSGHSLARAHRASEEGARRGGGGTLPAGGAKRLYLSTCSEDGREELARVKPWLDPKYAFSALWGEKRFVILSLAVGLTLRRYVWFLSGKKKRTMKWELM